MPEKPATSATVAVVISALAFLLSVLTALLTISPLKTYVDERVTPAIPNTTNQALSEDRISRVTASSFRQDYQSSEVYFPQNVLDDDPDTAWSECKDGDKSTGSRRKGATFDQETKGSAGCRNAKDPEAEGSGELVKLVLTESTRIKAVRVRNGYGRNNSTFFRNPRVAKLGVTPAPGTTLHWDLEDNVGYQTLVFDEPIDISEITFTIESVYPGEQFPTKPANDAPERDYRPLHDASLSDIELIPTTQV